MLDAVSLINTAVRVCIPQTVKVARLEYERSRGNQENSIDERGNVMAQLPPDGEWLVQIIGENTIVFHRYTEEEVVRFPTVSANANAIAQRTIYTSPLLTDEQKCFAHFWCGYFHAYAVGVSSDG